MSGGHGGARKGAGRKAGWSERGEAGGRPATGVRRVSFSVSCQPEELETIKLLASQAGKPVSRYLVDLALEQAGKQ